MSHREKVIWIAVMFIAPMLVLTWFTVWGFPLFIRGWEAFKQ